MSELQDLVDSLAVRLGRSVAIDDQRFRLAVFSSHTQEIDEVRRASILHREAPLPVTRRLTELGVQNALEPMWIGAIPELGLRPRVCIPIRFDGFLLGYIWLIEDTARLGDQQLTMCLEAASEAAPLMYRERVLDDRTRGRERQYVVELLDIASETRSMAARAAIAEGLIVPSGDYAVFVVDAESPAHSRTEQRVVTVLASLERIRRSLRPHGCMIGHLGPRGVLVVAVPAGDRAAKELLKIGHRLSADLRASGEAQDRWRIGQGPAVSELARSMLSYKGALDALEMASVVPELVDVAVWDDLGAWKLLSRMPDDDRVRRALHPGLAKIDELRDGPILLETLEAYLDHAGDAQETARVLHIHRTSLYGRLRRLEREAGIDVSSGENRLVIHMSLRLRRLFGRAEQLGSHSG